MQIVALGLIALAVPLYLVFDGLRDDLAQSASELFGVQTQLAALSTPAPDVQQLTAQVARTEAALAALTASQPPTGMDWPQLAGVIDSYDPQQITLLALTEADNQIILEGRATDNAAVVAYIQSLAASPLFLDIERQSVGTVPTPDAVPNDASKPSAEVRPVRFVLNLVVNPP